MTDPIIRILDSRDASAFQRLRLRGLAEIPEAFASSFEEECELTLDETGQRLDDQASGVVLGAFIADELVGLMGIRRDRHRKLAHRALLWGVYVAPEGRQHGVGKALGTIALKYAREQLGARQVILGVGAKNTAAQALYRRLGFQQFAVEPDYLCVDGKYFDEIHMIHFFGDPLRR
jgi:ribosomal protein S18 acetylase RimI-like enzyme